MRLEDEIKTKKFRDEHQKLMVNLMYTSNWVKLHNTSFLKKYKLTLQQYNILRILRGQHPNPASVNLLIERMLDKMSNASRLVEKLRLKQLVIRQECANDRRQADVLITQKGLDLLEVVDQDMQIAEESFKGITREEAEYVNAVLDKMRG